jgi:hypothetical protein
MEMRSWLYTPTALSPVTTPTPTPKPIGEEAGWIPDPVRIQWSWEVFVPARSPIAVGTLKLYSLLLMTSCEIGRYRGADKSLARPGKKRRTGHLQPRRNWPTWASNALITQPILRIWPRRTTTYSLDRKKTSEREVGRAKDLSAPQ